MDRGSAHQKHLVAPPPPWLGSGGLAPSGAARRPAPAPLVDVWPHASSAAVRAPGFAARYAQPLS
eukprot:7250930-Lingulodinium_polyedra.AAC.1